MLTVMEVSVGRPRISVAIKSGFVELTTRPLFFSSGASVDLGGFFSGVAVPIGSVVAPTAVKVTSGVCVATAVQPSIAQSKIKTTSIAKICLIR